MWNKILVDSYRYQFSILYNILKIRYTRIWFTCGTFVSLYGLQQPNRVDFGTHVGAVSVFKNLGTFLNI